MKRLGLAFLGLLACGEIRTIPDDGGTVQEDATTSPLPIEQEATNQLIGVPIRDLDILFVVDNSNSMADKQQEMAFRLPSLIQSLERGAGPINLHIGVVSTDVGAGPYNITGCLGEGDSGILQFSANGANCETPTDSYIAQNGGTKNFTGGIGDVFSCIATLGTAGCGFEQPLESMRLALNGSQAQNAGFLRDDAMLAVVVLTDEDDCSTETLSMFDTDPSLDNLTSTLGPLSSFRCFEFGVVCDPDNPRNAGSRSDCKSRENSPYMYPMGEYAEFLRGLKSTGGRVVFSAIAGVGPVTVQVTEGEDPRLTKLCSTQGNTSSVPAVRIADLSKRLGMPRVANICDAVGGPMSDIGTFVNSMMSGSCLAGSPTDECRIVDVENFGQAGEKVVQELLDCDDSTTEACFRFVPNADRCGASGIEVIIDRRGNNVPPNSLLVASCANR